MKQPMLLDLFCGAGGATKGYQRAGFYVVGVDLNPQPNYCGDEFVQADALDYFDGNWWLFDAWHASPPCQKYSNLSFTPGREGIKYPDLVEPVRGYFEDCCKTHWTPWVMENVVTAPLNTSLVLCGTQFGLKVFRHRAFESNVLLWNIPHRTHAERIKLKAGKRMAQYFTDQEGPITVAGHLFSLEAGSRAMGIDWMSRDELAEAIPPAYTEYIGRQLIEVIRSKS